MTMDDKQKQSMDGFIDWLIDEVLFPKEVADGQRERNTNQSSDKALPLQT